MYDIGLRIKQARKKRGVTQKMLAKRVNRSVQAISSYERNVQPPPTEILISIALALNESPTYFLEYEAEPSLSLKPLTEEQRELIELLYVELTDRDKQVEPFSKRQMEIIRRLMVCFSK
jgi:transcriptional regulator with XRE-family HTH domain